MMLGEPWKAVAVFSTCDWLSSPDQTLNLPSNSPKRPEKGGKSAELWPPPQSRFQELMGGPGTEATPPLPWDFAFAACLSASSWTPFPWAL